MRASRGEIKIEEILSQAGLNFTEEYSFPGLVSSSGRPLRFDFAVFDDAAGAGVLVCPNRVCHLSVDYGCPTERWGETSDKGTVGIWSV